MFRAFCACPGGWARSRLAVTGPCRPISLLPFGGRLGGGSLFQGPVQRLRRRRRALCRAWQAWLYAFQFAIAARAASRRLVSTGVFSDGCSDRASIMAASPDRSWQLPRQAIISSVDIGSNQFRDLKRGTRLSVGRCLAASYVADARLPVCFRRPDCCFRAPFVGQRHRPRSALPGLTTASAIMASRRRTPTALARA
jgi:hypothetical protein